MGFRDIQGLVFAEAVAPQVIKDNAAWTATAIDTAGAEYVTIICHIGATDIAMAALKIQECDTSGGSYADITGATATGTTIDGTTGTLPSATDDNKFVVFEISKANRKRYFKVSATAGDGTVGTYMSAVAILSPSNVNGYSSTTKGCLSVIRV